MNLPRRAHAHSIGANSTERLGHHITSVRRHLTKHRQYITFVLVVTVRVCVWVYIFMATNLNHEYRSVSSEYQIEAPCVDRPSNHPKYQRGNAGDLSFGDLYVCTMLQHAAVRTKLVRCGDDIIILAPLHSNLDSQAEALESGVIGVPEKDVRVYLGVLRDVLLVHARGHQLKRTKEAGCVTHAEQLLGIVSVSCTTDNLRGSHLQLERTVPVRLDSTTTTTASCCRLREINMILQSEDAASLWHARVVHMCDSGAGRDAVSKRTESGCRGTHAEGLIRRRAGLA